MCVIVFVCAIVYCMCYCLFVGDDASEEESSDKARMMMYIQYLHTCICILIVGSNPM